MNVPDPVSERRTLMSTGASAARAAGSAPFVKTATESRMKSKGRKARVISIPLMKSQNAAQGSAQGDPRLRAVRPEDRLQLDSVAKGGSVGDPGAGGVVPGGGPAPGETHRALLGH